MYRTAIFKTGYVLLLPVYFLLHNYNELFGFIPLLTLLLTGLCMYAIAALVYFVARRFTKNPSQALFVTWCVLLLLLFWGAWHDMIKSIAGKTVVSKYVFLFPTTVGLLALLIRYCFRHSSALTHVTKYLSLVLLILCCMDLVSLYINFSRFQRDGNLIYPGKPISNAWRPCNRPDSLKPDIYLLIFDEYTHNRTLQRLWQYDNHDITEWLQQRGFHLPDSSKAEYSYTPYSLSSILNLNYLNKNKSTIDRVPYYTLKAVKSMSNNETFSILQKEGYKVHFIGPFNNTFGKVTAYSEFDHFAEIKLFNHTLPGRAYEDLGWRFNQSKSRIDTGFAMRARDYEKINWHIKSTANTDANRPPQFVYGHTMITHKPHLYDSSGKVYTYDNLPNVNKPFDTYINQVRKANENIKELVTHIQSHNRKNTIIIIMGDHGFRHLPDEQSAFFFPNFCAFYFPDRTYTQVPANMSAVNTFRIVFNQYFCQNLKLLKDSSILVKY